MEEKIKIDSIKLSDVERMVKSVRKNVGEADVELSLEFMLTAFFPTCWDNMQKALNQQYTLGYIAGLKDANIETSKDNADCFCD